MSPSTVSSSLPTPQSLALNLRAVLKVVQFMAQGIPPGDQVAGRALEALTNAQRSLEGVQVAIAASALTWAQGGVVPSAELCRKAEQEIRVPIELLSQLARQQEDLDSDDSEGPELPRERMH